MPILNVSTFLTNVTLVEGRHLEQTLDTLSEELDASIDGLLLAESKTNHEEEGVYGGEDSRMMTGTTEKMMADFTFSKTTVRSTD